jgi:very-short-patch-repair endonuclease
MKTPILYHYPIVLVPKIIRDFVEAHPWHRHQTKLSNLNAPTLPSPPSQSNQKLTWLVGWLCACAGTVAAKLAGADNQAFQMALFFCVALGFCGVVYYFLSNRLRNSAYQRLLEIYQKELKDYAELEKRYWASVKATSRRQRDKLVARNAEFAALLKEKVRQPSSKAVKFLRKGISEESFWPLLNKYFNEVGWGVEFEIPGSDKRFAADFVIVHPESYIHICVEIDEPYTYIEGTLTPCHTVNDEGDKRRNRFFLEGGWVVVRFAEEQVVKYPESCCKAIAQLIAELTGDFTILQQLRKAPLLPFVKQWTEKEAYRKARKKERHSYLEASGVLKNSPNLKPDRDVGEKQYASKKHLAKNERLKPKKRARNYSKRK